MSDASVKPSYCREFASRWFSERNRDHVQTVVHTPKQDDLQISANCIHEVYTETTRSHNPSYQPRQYRVIPHATREVQMTENTTPGVVYDGNI